jgi:hypothetical protein
MTVLRCTQKLLTALRVRPATPDHATVGEPSAARLGDWTMNLLHVRPIKLVLAVSEHDRLGLLVEAAPFSTLPQRFTGALFGHLLTLGVPPDIARRECDATQPLVITATTGYDNRRSIQGNMTDYTFLIEWMLQKNAPLADINAQLARHISKPTGHAWPGDLAKKRLCER